MRCRGRRIPTMTLIHGSLQSSLVVLRPLGDLSMGGDPRYRSHLVTAGQERNAGVSVAAKMTNVGSARTCTASCPSHPHLPSPLKVKASAPSHTPSLDPQGMPPLACPSPDDLFRTVYDLTSTTKIIGTKPFAYGGYSDIWRGYEWGAGATRDVAIKIIRPVTRQKLTSDRIKKRISREIIPWSAVVHQNILPFYGLFWVDGPDDLPAMVYPYCEAGNCSEFLTNNPDVDRMAIANILMKQDGTPLIADFGLSRLVMEFSTGLTTSSSRGSYRWMAPELFGGVDNHVLVLITTASDVWAFGCLCLEIILGVIPWASFRSDAAIMLAVVKNRLSPPLPSSTGNTSLGHIIKHCWMYEPSQRPSMLQLVDALFDVDPERLHISPCVLLPTAMFSDSPPAIRNSDSDFFPPTFDSPPMLSDSHLETRTKTPVAVIPLHPLFSPREPLPSHQRGASVPSTGATPYLDMLSFTPSDSSSSGPASRDEPPLFEIPSTPLFGPGPRRPSRGIRETRQNSQPMWPRTPQSASFSTLPQPLRGGGDDVFRPEAWRTRDTTPASTRPPSQSSLHIWTPPRSDSRHSSHIPSMSPLSQTSSDRSTTTTSLTTPVTPVGPHTQYHRHHHSASYGPPLLSPDHVYQGNYFAAPLLQTHSSWPPNGSVPRDFQDFRLARSTPIRISAPDGTPVILPERKLSSSSPIKTSRPPR
ncbi:unnamed protein product [Rhizoctonia solani]|uniref:Protein kinase domain-containing protein n=1 Tax=Rhizoctonia solani TaxID=456999 RepID=A0A8H2ZW33_9AGAM|nr:unnamed protein product [Rhizoctonia solani]